MSDRFLSLLAVAWCLPAACAEQIAIAENGSLALRLFLEAAEPQSTVLDFGLPPTPPAKRSSEKCVFHTEWITNGIRYTQSILITEVETTGRSAATNRSRIPVLLVNIEGENTNTSYTEASAELALSARGKRESLELKDGLIWRMQRAPRAVLAALEIPDSGIKVSRGDVLKFSGNMPPSLKGSMTLKLPLEEVGEEQTAERLRDIDFQEEMRQALKVKHAPSAEAHWGLAFTLNRIPETTNSAPASTAAR